MNLVILFEADFVSSSMVVLKGRRRNHLISVCRVNPGDTIRAGLLNGKLGTASVTMVNDQQIDLEVSLGSLPPPPLPVTLIVALPRPKSLKKALEAAASMGVKKIIIIESWRVEKSFWESPLLRPENIQEHLILGLEQGRDTVLPVVEFRKRFKPFVQDEVPEIIKNSRAFVAHPYAQKSLPYAVASPVTLAIGPEGGFIPYEVDLLEKHGFEPVSLGERILRVEYAIPAILGRLM